MTIKRVNSDALNLREEPKVSNGNILAVLPKAHPVTVLAPAGTNGWVQVETQIDSGRIEGFVSERLLRDPVSDAKEELMGAAIAEWLRFDRGAGQEHHTPYFRFVGEMWRAINLNLDGKHRDQPWSAAFISWVVRKAGAAYDGFKFSPAHSKYIHDAIRKRLDNAPAPFWGFRLNEHKVGLGDLVCQWRLSQRTFDDAAAQDAFPSHCDIVVEVSNGTVKALGGNNGHSVRFKQYARDANGHLIAGNKVFAILCNNA